MSEIIVQEVSEISVSDLLMGGHDPSVYFSKRYIEFLRAYGDLRFLLAKTDRQNVALMFVYYNDGYIPVSNAPWALITYLGRFNSLNMLDAIKAFRSKLSKQFVLHLPSLKFSNMGALGLIIDGASVRLTSVVELDKYEYRRDFRTKIKKSLNASLTFQSSDFNRDIYLILAENRAALGATLSMTYEDLGYLLKIVPNSIYSVKQQDRVLASGIVLHIKEDYSYVLYWGDIPEYRNLNTMAFLVSGIFDDLCLNKKARFLELGTSYDDKELQLGLFNFKESIGASPDIRVSL
jgi:hypothetical protein